MKLLRLRKIGFILFFFVVLFEIKPLKGFTFNGVKYEKTEIGFFHSGNVNSSFSNVNKEFNIDYFDFGVFADTINVDQPNYQALYQDVVFNYSNKGDEKEIKEIERKLFARMEEDINKINSRKNKELEMVSKNNSNSQNISVLSVQNNLPTQAEYNALMDFYQATNGANWIQNSGWSSANPNIIQDVSGFYGVTTNANGNVVGIFLPQNEVTGEIPESFGDLVYLEQLYLFSNNLYRYIPQSIGNLVNLKGLYLNSSRINWSTIPESIGNLTNLEYLALHSNYLEGSIPSSIGNLTKLKELSLHFTKLEGNIPSSIGNLHDLQFLQLMGSNLSGPIPSSFSNLTNLYSFRVHDNQLTGPVPSYFCSFPNLETLSLYNNKFTGTLPVCLYNSSVNNLLIANNDFSIESVIEMAVNISNPSDYLPQNQSLDTVYVSVIEGNFLVLNTDLGLNSQGVSQYRWMKNEVPLVPNFLESAHEFTDTSFACKYYPEGSSGTDNCNGVYYVEIQNSLLPPGTILKGPPLVFKTISQTLDRTICLFFIK